MLALRVLLALTLTAAACTAAACTVRSDARDSTTGAVTDTPTTGADTVTGADTLVTAADSDASAAATDEGVTSEGAGTTAGSDTGETVAPYVGTLVERSLLCKLISDTALDDPTANATHTRFNLRGTDLGIGLVTGEWLHLFFGDTVGYRAIWDFGEDPDAVARVPLAAVVADPAALCSQLEFYVTADVPSVAAGVDPGILRDFAGAWMTPPPGHTIAEYIAQPAGPFANMPGTFEVPSGAMVADGSTWLFYAGLVETQPRTRATRSYLARWSDPGGAAPNYDIVRAVDDLVAGALGGHFIQVAPVVRDDHVELFGTGDYRRSGVALARVGLDDLEAGVGTELFDPSAGAWHVAGEMDPDARAALGTVFDTDGVGELSVHYLEEPNVYLATYQRELHDGGGAIVDNRVVMRIAREATGPWSDPITVVDMADPAFAAAHCCSATCEGDQILNCFVAGLYAAYALPTVATTDLGGGAYELAIPMLASTWDPYNVVLFSVRLRLDPA